MRTPTLTLALLAIVLATLPGCGTCPVPAPSPAPSPESAQDRFWRAMAAHCGRAYEGRVVEDSIPDSPFHGQRLVAHFRHCSQEEMHIPFHVGDNRSRTWILTRTDTGLRLKHDHRHEDGSEEDLTWYGGDTAGPGTPTTQEFHADEHTAQLLPPAATNVWTFQLVLDESGAPKALAYALRREGTDRRFRAEFDLTKPVDPPPAPWGHD
jgi:hypothetical protein